MPRLDVLLKREDLATTPIADRVCIVLDVLFATTTIVTALAHGADAVWPAQDREEALAIAARLPAPVRLAGEYLAEPLEGFDSPLPLALSATLSAGDHLVYATTNGTLALRQAAGARVVYAAALVNVRATLLHVLAHHPDADVLIVCSGSMGRANLEDFRGAGEFAAAFAPHDYLFGDAAIAALAMRSGLGATQALHVSRVGRMMAERGAEIEIDHAAGIDTFDVVATLHPDDAVRKTA